ncbi:MAG: 50S ribosomal protein L30 [Acidobacteria bacterium]|nr:50S ribosomal protein L30 [Acidobacteriota bacterium]
MAAKTMRIQQYRSTIGQKSTIKTVVKHLGFRRLNQTLERPDTAAIRGMVAKVPHLVRIVEDSSN